MSEIKKQRNTPVTTTEFIQRSEKMHGLGRYDYSNSVYVNSRVKVNIRCLTHGIFYKNPKDHMRGSGCPKCGTAAMIATKRAKEEAIVIKKFENVHSNRYDYNDVCYKNSITPCNIKCKVHGVFSQVPASHIQGHGCPKCAASKRGNHRVKNAAVVIKGFKQVHGELYNYDAVKYTNSKVPIDIVCAAHGTFQQTPNNHSKGQGCPMCALTGFNRSKHGLLYYIKVEYKGQIAYKIGITNHSIKKRYVGELHKITILAERVFSIGAEAYLKEQRLLKMYKALKYTGTPLLKSGNTELFHTNIIKDVDAWFN